MTDLHTRLVEAITARLNLADAATPGPWEAENVYHPLKGCRCLGCYEDEPYAKAIHALDARGEDSSPILRPEDAGFIAANDPAFVAGACRADLELLEQHRPVPIPDGPPGTACATCGPFGDNAGAHWWDSMAGHDWTPCDFVRNRAGVYGVNLDEQEG